MIAEPPSPFGARFAGPSSALSATLRGLQPSPQSEILLPINNPTTTKSSEALPKLT